MRQSGNWRSRAMRHRRSVFQDREVFVYDLFCFNRDIKPLLIPQRLASLQGVRDALLRFALAAQTDERFPLEIHQILFAYILRGR